jgi:hypothetical protein
MKDKKKYYTVGTVPKPIYKSQKEANLIPLSHKYTTIYFPGLAQALQWRVEGLN